MEFNMELFVILESYVRSPEYSGIDDPVDPEAGNVDMIPQKSEHSMMLIHRLMVPPAAPQVSGRVIQASVWIPRSTH